LLIRIAVTATSGRVYLRRWLLVVSLLSSPVNSLKLILNNKISSFVFMKYLLIFLLFPFAVQAQSVTNQNVTDTTPFIPWHTPERLEQFKKEPIVTGRIIFLGNSITEMGNWQKVLNDTTVINRGIGGDITYGVLKRLKDITDRYPSKLFILLGINDIGKDVPDVVIADNYLKIVKEVHSKCPNTKIYVQSVLPLNPTLPRFPQHYDKEEHVLALNKLLKANAQMGNYTFVDIFHLFVDADGRLDSRYTLEGLHLKPEAYVIWTDYLRKQGYL
jgi:lysophospholipase L1-like esterase